MPGEHGVLYELGEGAHLAEVEFSCRIALRVSDWPYPPPEANLPPEQAAQARLLQTPIWSWRYEVNGSLFVSLRLQDDKITDIALERFEYEHPSAETLLVPSPVFLRQGYS